METRELKYRIWDSRSKRMSAPFDVKESWGHFLVDFGDYRADAAAKGMEWLQYTGLKDKNGVEIYEGDVLRVDWNDNRYPIHGIGPVKWDAGNACWQLGEGGSPEEDASYHFEVIGNIYENPELLATSPAVQDVKPDSEEQ